MNGERKERRRERTSPADGLVADWFCFMTQKVCQQNPGASEAGDERFCDRHGNAPDVNISTVAWASFVRCVFGKTVTTIRSLRGQGRDI